MQTLTLTESQARIGGVFSTDYNGSTIEVEVPPGVQHGHSIQTLVPEGDHYLAVEVLVSFRKHVEVTVDLNPDEASGGAAKIVQVCGKDVAFKFPAGTMHQQRFVVSVQDENGVTQDAVLNARVKWSQPEHVEVAPLKTKPAFRLPKRSLIGAAAVAATLFGLTQVVGYLQGATVGREDQSVLERVAPNLPPRERVAQLEKLRAQIHTPSAIEKVDAALAVALGQAGQIAQRRGEIVEAEHLYRQAIEKDAKNSAPYTYLAGLYEAEARKKTDPELWHQAAENWENAWTRESDGQQKRAYGDGAATAYLMYAELVCNRGSETDRRIAREALYNARETVQAKSQVDYRITELLDRLR